MESMREQVRGIAQEQKEIGYESVFTEGESATRDYMKKIFPDWRTTGVTSVLHEKRGGYANNQASLEGLAKKALANGAEIYSDVTVNSFAFDSAGAVTAVNTDKGDITCDEVVIAVGPWVRQLWLMLGLPDSIGVRANGTVHETPMWNYWSLQEGTLGVKPEFLTDINGNMPPVTHVDSDSPLHSVVDGRLLCEKPWGIYYKPDLHF